MFALGKKKSFLKIAFPLLPLGGSCDVRNSCGGSNSSSLLFIAGFLIWLPQGYKHRLYFCVSGMEQICVVFWFAFWFCFSLTRVRHSCVKIPNQVK